MTEVTSEDEPDTSEEITALKKAGIQLPIVEIVGSTPPVRRDANPSVAAATEALDAKQHPARLTPMIAPESFDHEKYRGDESYRKQYLEVVEAGRVFQTAQPGEDVPRLRRVTSTRQRIFQDGSVALAVRAVPGAPVTFTSFDLGRFKNQLTSITVEAGDDGRAVTEFFGAPGTINDVNILAGSPVTSGQVRFVVQVDLPTPAPGSPDPRIVGTSAPGS